MRSLSSDAGLTASGPDVASDRGRRVGTARFATTTRAHRHEPLPTDLSPRGGRGVPTSNSCVGLETPRWRKTGPAAPPGWLLEGSDDLGYPPLGSHLPPRSQCSRTRRSLPSATRGSKLPISSSRSTPLGDPHFLPQPQSHAALYTPQHQRARGASYGADGADQRPSFTTHPHAPAKLIGPCGTDHPSCRNPRNPHAPLGTPPAN